MNPMTTLDVLREILDEQEAIYRQLNESVEFSSKNSGSAGIRPQPADAALPVRFLCLRRPGHYGGVPWPFVKSSFFL